MFSKIQSYATSLASKAKLYANKSVYYSKVAAEVSKQVYLKEGLQPPSIADFQSVYTQLYKQTLGLVLKPKDSLAVFKNVQKNDILRYGSYGIQLAGLYSLGEIIGRRKVVGYTNYSAHA